MYIGKGEGHRWKRHDARAKTNPHYAAILKAAGGDLPCVILIDNLSAEKSFEIEEVFTKAIGIESEGGPLVNCGHGGRGGLSGVIRSKKFRKHRSKIAKELWQNKDYRKIMLRNDRGRSGNTLPRSEAFKIIVGKKLKGNTHSLGMVHSDSAKAKMSIARKGVSKSKEHSAAIANALRGHKHPPERIEAMIKGQFRTLEYKQANRLDFMTEVG